MRKEWKKYHNEKIAKKRNTFGEGKSISILNIYIMYAAFRMGIDCNQIFIVL